MYKTKPCAPCDMPAPGMPLRVLVLNASLKHGNDLSNTEELAQLVLEHMAEHEVSAEVVRLADRTLLGQPVREDRAERLANQATRHMARNLARNLVCYAQLLKKHPLVPQAG